MTDVGIMYIIFTNFFFKFNNTVSYVQTKVSQTIEISLAKPNIVKTNKNSDDEDDPSPVAKKKSKMVSFTKLL